MYKYALFDLDGTLTDPKEGICKSTQYALHKMGIEEKNLDNLTTFIGPPLKDSFMKYYGMSEENALEAIKYYRERFAVVGIYENIPYDGISRVLNNLKKSGIKLAVASSKPKEYVIKILEHFKLLEYFDVIEGAELDGSHVNKADNIKDAVLKLYNNSDYNNKKMPDKLTLEKEVVMVGDRSFDVEGAHEFGIKCIGVTYGYALKGELKKAKADMLAKTVNDIEKIILGKNIADSDNEIKKYKSETSYIRKKEKKSIKNSAIDDVQNKSSFFKSVYCLVPFAVFILTMMATVSVCDILYKEIAIKRVTAISDFLNNNTWVYSAGVSGLANLMAGIVIILCYSKTDIVVIKIEKKIIPSICLGALLALSVNMLFMYFFKLFPQINNTAPKADVDMPVFMGVLLYCIITPLSEELLFRYMIYGRVKKTMGTGIAIIMSSLFFGLYHGNVTQAVYAFIMGIVMALIYSVTDNFLMPVAFHISANSIVYLSRFVPVDAVNSKNGGFICALTFLLSIALFRMIIITKKIENREERKNG